MKPVILHAAALEELSEAGEFYRRESIGTAASFVATIEASFKLLGTTPLMGSPVFQQVRSFTLRRFPYSILYMNERARVYVLAIAHHRRRPGYWLKRLK